MNARRKRGRPTVASKLFDDGEFVEKHLLAQDNFRTHRSISDMAYCTTASILLSEAASEIDNLDELCHGEYLCRSILVQLGRMYHQNNFDEASVIAAAKVAIEAKRLGSSVKDIEAYIRRGRTTNTW